MNINMYQENDEDGWATCPECMEVVPEDELEVFGGLCETCNEEMNNE